MRLSVLDQSPISEGTSAQHALQNSVDLAQHCEELGFYRYWLAEHHGDGFVAGPSPEVLVAAIATATKEMRIGSGGVMLRHYSPLKVAENFGVLSALFPDRIDLGVGRASGAGPTATHFLRRNRSGQPIDDFPQQLTELLAYFERDSSDGGPIEQLAATLPGGGAPEPWLLGSSEESADWAARLGLPYAFADFINPRGARITSRYREAFAPGRWLSRPRVGVALWALAAEDESEAHRLATSYRMASDLLFRGRPGPVPPPEEAVRYVELQRDTLMGSGSVHTGTPDQVGAELEETAAAYGAEEVFVVTITHDHQVRRSSYELLATELGLAL